MGKCASKQNEPEDDVKTSTAPKSVDTAQPPVKAPAPVESTNKPESEENSGKKDDEESEVSVLTGIEEYYDLGDEIGRGGFSIVYEATDKKTNEKVAVKCVQLTIQADEASMTALKREIRIMKKVNHPNILKLHEVFVEDENFYLVMELVPGKELFERIIDRGQYSEKHASNIIRQISAAVDYLHQNGIAHRDLKPENLLSSGDDDNEVIKIIDFGLSKKFGDEQLVTSVGSPGYVAPEVLTAESYDKSVDMWSVGVILYILLCGYPPFFGPNSTELFKRIIEVKYDFDDPAWEDISDAPKEIIRRLLVKEPSSRMTAREVSEHPWVKGIGVGDKQLGAGAKMKTNNVK